jgi:hypothetical protein
MQSLPRFWRTHSASSGGRRTRHLGRRGRIAAAGGLGAACAGLLLTRMDPWLRVGLMLGLAIVALTMLAQD